MIGNTHARSNWNPARTRRLASDLGKRGWAQCVSQDFKTNAMRSGISECHTTASQSAARNIARPPRFRTRNASERRRLTSGMYSGTCVHTTTSNEASDWASCVASPTAYFAYGHALWGKARKEQQVDTDFCYGSWPCKNAGAPAVRRMIFSRWRMAY
jgi:hypothetical protein